MYCFHIDIAIPVWIYMTKRMTFKLCLSFRWLFGILSKDKQHCQLIKEPPYWDNNIAPLGYQTASALVFMSYKHTLVQQKKSKCPELFYLIIDAEMRCRSWRVDLVIVTFFATTFDFQGYTNQETRKEFKGILLHA